VILRSNFTQADFDFSAIESLAEERSSLIFEEARRVSDGDVAKGEKWFAPTRRDGENNSKAPRDVGLDRIARSSGLSERRCAMTNHPASCSSRAHVFANRGWKAGAQRTRLCTRINRAENFAMSERRDKQACWPTAWVMSRTAAFLFAKFIL
jgi:hypothetical protein